MTYMTYKGINNDPYPNRQSFACNRGMLFINTAPTNHIQGIS